ncbi:transcription factor IIIC subunit delta N-term-domain-containing protein [Boeremia exigua]|uniref:transcription factor IIIC subunit delta N-term-domain-containing protein n=1 Tax=Boeremia exigua TaxID=749465 RepID=UPI001E8CEF9A|nr:transcription factor IIIC subunit delta N-term-domain-containing protein [Boeremia exigua]KAH6644126.1 transcription factor IIIC subunit delta N-term-domain-containing protein [Boeremia exigua]
MADVTELRCWPSCVEALDWSQDNIIALASDERVELLFPNTVSYERDNDVPQWQHVPLQVPWFSSDELPVKDPAPLSNYSVGEEISPSVPVAIAWSPPGLAKHRRCALAVLTSNLVLSMWSAEGKLQDESSWNRRLLVNHALIDYFSEIETMQTSHVSSDAEEQMRLRTRVRSFAWAPALPHATNTMGTQTSYGRQFITVANDDNQLLFLSVDSPTSTLGSSQSWKATVFTHMALEPREESKFTDPLFFGDLMKQQRFISHIAWSPWVAQGDSYRSVVVYATNEEVRGRLVTWRKDEFKLEAEVTYPGISLRYSGPMSWCPKLDNECQATLAIFTNSGLVYLTISVNDASIVDKAEHDLDGRWDQVSGVAWDYEKQPSPHLHFSSLLSTVQSPTAVVAKLSSGLTSVKIPNWKEKIENSMVLFSVKNDLKGHSKTKVWGLTSSPLGDFIAACNSLHPSDSIEYGPPADRRGTIALSTLRQYGKIRESFPSRNTTAEGVLFTLKKLAENTVEDADQMPAFAEEAVGKLLLAYKPLKASGNDVLATAPTDLEDHVTNFKTCAIFEENNLRDRYSILVSHAVNDTASNELARTLISYRLATMLQKLPSALLRTAFSQEILMHHQRLVALIDNLFLFGDAEPETVEQHEAEQSAAMLDDDAMDTEHTSEGAASSSTNQTEIKARPRLEGTAIATDHCDFCSAPIPFTDLTTAACANGHEFPRCGVSFIAIQAPGITKYCGICSTPVLSEEFVQAQDSREEAEAESEVTLASVLFQACDICIFCGGKYIG